MSKSRILPFVAALLLTAGCAMLRNTSRRAIFEGGAESETKWAVADFKLPSDWTPYNFLVMEMRASSPQRFFLTFYGSDGAQRRRMQPLPNVWIRAAVPLQYYRAPNRVGFDLASVGKVPRNSFWITTGGGYGPLNAVQSIGMSMEYPLGKPVIEVRSIQLAKDDPGSDILDKKPVVDEFGQWIPASWPGKVQSLDQLKSEWAAEDAGFREGQFNYCPYGGYKNAKAKATGFFHVEQVDGKWWFVDPDGHLFFSTSSNGMGAGGADARIKGREDYYAALPPQNPTPAGGRSRSGFYAWNLSRRLGADWATKWRDLAIRRLDSWGLNTIGCWSDSRLWDLKKKPYIVFLRGWGMETGYLGMPDVYAADFPKVVDKAAAEQCAPRRNDPYLLGYFVGNEPPWPGRESVVVDTIFERAPDSAIGREAKKFLAEGDTPERRKQFVYRAFIRYTEVINAAIRRHDPNHLNMGLRFGTGLPPEEMVRACRTYDVYSMNNYNYSVDPKTLQEVYRMTGRPILIGEFHIGVPGRGLAAGLVQARDQKERAAAYRYYVEQAAAFPALIGVSWFQWVDQPSLGRQDGENYNIGLVDTMDRPYRELVEGMQATHSRLYEVHSGTAQPFSQKPLAN